MSIKDFKRCHIIFLVKSLYIDIFLSIYNMWWYKVKRGRGRREKCEERREK
jgi:hypothetical protein